MTFDTMNWWHHISKTFAERESELWLHQRMDTELERSALPSQALVNQGRPFLKDVERGAIIRQALGLASDTGLVHAFRRARISQAIAFKEFEILAAFGMTGYVYWPPNPEAEKVGPSTADAGYARAEWFDANGKCFAPIQWVGAVEMFARLLAQQMLAIATLRDESPEDAP